MPLSREFRFYLVAAVLFALANSSDAFLILRAREMGLPLLMAPLAWALLHVVKSVTSLWGGGLSDRVGRRPVLLVGWVLYALVYGAFAWLTATWATWLLFAAYGIFFGATEGVAKAYVADLVPSAARGRAFGLLGMVRRTRADPDQLRHRLAVGRHRLGPRAAGAGGGARPAGGGLAGAGVPADGARGAATAAA